MTNTSIEKYITQAEPTQLDIAEFIAHDKSFTVADPEGLATILYSDESEESKADFIIASKHAIEYEEYNRLHCKGYKRNMYSLYLNYANQKFVLDEGTFNKYFKYINNIELETSELSCSPKIVQAISLLRRLNANDENILKTYKSLCQLQSITVRDIWPDLDEFELQNTAVYQQALTSFLHLINVRKTDVLDFLSYLSLDETYNDYILENRFVSPRIITTANNQSSDGPILLIEPSPFMLRKWQRRYPFGRRKTIIVLRNSTYIQLLQDNFTDNKKYIFTELQELELLLQNPELKPAVTVMFMNHGLTQSTAEAIACGLIHEASDTHSLLVFGSDNMIVTKASPVHKILCNCNITDIDLLPAQIPNATFPQRKILLHSEYGYTTCSGDISVKQYILRKGNNQSLSGKAFSTNISSAIYTDAPETIRSIFRDNSLTNFNKGTGIRLAAARISFSNEINIEYTKSGAGTKENPFRIAAYMLRFNGSRIPTCKASTKLLSDDDVESWLLNEYPYSHTKHSGEQLFIRSAAAVALIPEFQNKAISPASFIYLHPELEDNLPASMKQALNLVSHSSIGSIPMNRITASMLEECINFELTEQTRLTEKQLAFLLKQLFISAIESGNCKKNPADQIIARYTYSNDGLNDVKNALTQKFFTQKQMVSLTQHALRCITNDDGSLGLAILLRLYLGLEANIICALLWKDFNITGVPSLKIHHQLCNDGSSFVPFSHVESVRTIPLTTELKNILKEEMQHQLEVIAKGDSNYLSNCSIITGTDYVLNGQICVMSPQKLNTKLRKLIKKYRLDDDIISVPDDKYGTIETNLAYYQGDLFKSNYWHYLVKEHPSIEDGELSYLLGRKAHSVFDTNYCDYGRPDSQEKLRRLQPKLKGVKK